MQGGVSRLVFFLKCWRAYALFDFLRGAVESPIDTCGVGIFHLPVRFMMTEIDNDCII